jgi:hypothetical protein
MHPNLRFALAVLAGVVSGGIIVAAIVAMGHFFFPPPAEITLNAFQDIVHFFFPPPAEMSVDAICEYVKNAPIMAMVFTLIAWTAGAITAGVLAKLIYRTNNKPAFIAGLIQLIFVLINLIVVGCHPLWMEVTGALLPVPMAMLGSRLIASR